MVRIKHYILMIIQYSAYSAHYSAKSLPYAFTLEIYLLPPPFNIDLFFSISL